MLTASSVFGQPKPHPIPTGPASVVESKDNTLFNGWKLTPAGRHVGVNALPLKMAISPDGQTLAAVCSGRWNGLALIDLKTEQTKQWLPLYRTFNGVGFSSDGKKIYVSGGNSDSLYIFDFDGNKAAEPKTIHLGEQPANSQKENFFTGLAVDPKTGRLFICNEGTNEVWVVDPKTEKVEAKWQTGSHPYTCALGADGKYLFASNWGDKSVSVIDTETGEQTLRIAVGLRPNEMAVSRDGRLFVACAGDNTVHVIQTQAPVDNDRDATPTKKCRHRRMRWRLFRRRYTPPRRRLDAGCAGGVTGREEPVRRQRRQQRCDDRGYRQRRGVARRRFRSGGLVSVRRGQRWEKALCRQWQGPEVRAELSVDDA